MNVTGFVGNKRITDQLGALVDSGRFPQALVIEGEDGIGKKTLAKLIAAALVCRGENKPCKACPQCRKAYEGVHPDISEYSGSGGANSFHIDTVRDIIRDVYIRPNEASRKIYILENAHTMSIPAQNAILKVLEEPPEYVVFILTVRSKSMLLDTVLSRAVTVTLEGVDCKEGAAFICSLRDNISYHDAENALLTFNGNIGRALDSLDGGNEEKLAEICCDMCKALVNDSEYALLQICYSFNKDRNGIVFACDFLKNIFRDALVCGTKTDLASGRRDIAVLLKAKLSAKKLVDLIGVCDTLKKTALMNSNNSLLITKLCYALRRAAGR